MDLARVRRCGWTRTLEARERIKADRPEAAFDEIDTDCRLVDGASSSNDGHGLYVDMTVTMEVTDKDGDQNTSSRTIELFTNTFCGF